MFSFIQWFFILMYSFGNSANSFKIQSNTLDISDGVNIFQNCFVHILWNHFTIVEPTNGTKIPLNDSYELKPLNFPVVLTRYNYFVDEQYWLYFNSQSHDRSCRYLFTDSLQFDRSLKVQHLSAPQQSVTLPCVVTIFIDSPACDGPMITSQYYLPAFQFAIRHLGSPIPRESFLTLQENKFLVHVGRIQDPSSIKILEHMYSIDISTLRSSPIVIELNPKISGLRLEEFGKILTCPKYKEYYESVRKTCRKYLVPEDDRPFYECCEPFIQYLDHQPLMYDHKKTKTWKEILTLGYAPCESRTVLIGIRNEAKSNGFSKQEQSEYMLDWLDRVGSFDYLFARIYLGNITHYYYNQREMLHIEMLTNDIRRVDPYGEIMFNTRYYRTLVKEIRNGVINSEIFFNGITNDEVRFVICSVSSQTVGLSLLGYVSAFTFDTWLLLLATGIGGVTILKNAVSGQQKSRFYTNLFCILINQGTNEIRQNKWFYGSWVLGGLFFTNNYLGDNINNLVAPLPPLKWDTFEQVLKNNFTIHSPDIDATLGEVSKISHDVILHYVSLGNVLYKSAFNISIFSSLYVQKNYKEFKQTLEERLNEIQPDRYDVFKTFRPGYHVEIISRCLKDAYVDIFSEVAKVNLQVRQQAATGSINANVDDIVVSRDKYGDIYHNIKISGNCLSPEKLLRKFHSFQQSGIELIWQNWKHRIELWNDTVSLAKENDEFIFKPSQLNGNIRVIFYVHIAWLSIAISIFASENIGAFQRYFYNLHHGCMKLCFNVINFQKKPNKSVLILVGPCNNDMSAEDLQSKTGSADENICI